MRESPNLPQSPTFKVLEGPERTDMLTGWRASNLQSHNSRSLNCCFILTVHNTNHCTFAFHDLPFSNDISSAFKRLAILKLIKKKSFKHSMTFTSSTHKGKALTQGLSWKIDWFLLLSFKVSTAGETSGFLLLGLTDSLLKDSGWTHLLEES